MTQIQKKIEDILKHVQENPSEVEIQTQIVVSLKGHVDRLDLCGAKNRKTIKDHFATATDGSGCFNIPKMWGLKKKLNLSSKDVPAAKKDKAVTLITTKNGLLALYKNTYIYRLSHKRRCIKEYKDLKSMKEKLFNLRYQIASQDKFENWEVKTVEKVCRA